MEEDLKESVKSHWENETCGTRYGSSMDKERFYEELKNVRYKLEPYINDFAKFDQSKNLKILEIGVGAGVDFSHWVIASDRYKPIGIDLTEASVKCAKSLLQAIGIPDSAYLLQVADAEHLPFEDSQFDLVYSWGVLHHSPNTEKCFREIFRVLKPNAVMRVMIYHRPSWTGFLLWLRYALFSGRIAMTQKEVVSKYLESPGTKVYTVDEAGSLLGKIGFVAIHLSTKLGPGDILSIKPSKKYQGLIYRILWKVYPRWLVKLFGDRFGLGLLIEAKKP